MEKSPHVMMVGDGAEQFAQSIGVTLVDPKYFYTETRWQQLQEELKKEQDKSADVSKAPGHGTVGAVALDKQGHLAAGTSTGGMTNKRFGRVGDSPIIGAGTYANNASCAVSATGHGEYFIRAVVAHDISAQMQYAGLPLGESVTNTLARMKALGGNGGVIAIDARGGIVMDFNSEGMFRGARTSAGRREVAIYR
jgi:beta-aspartyl-peptidase (threonine type)